jgi:hypothetical protein
VNLIRDEELLERPDELLLLEVFDTLWAVESPAVVIDV